MKRFCLLPLWCVCAGLMAPLAQAAPKKLSFIPLWSPQAQFAGYYVALEKGFYRDRGLEVDILTGGPEKPADFLLEKGKADIGTLWLSEAIKKTAQGVRLVNIAQIVQRSALMLVAKKSSGIRRVEDLDGKTVALWESFRLQPLALFKKYKLHVNIIPQTQSVNLFLRDGAAAASVMIYNEYHTIINAGLNPGELTTFFFYNYGLNFPEDGLYMLEKNFNKDPAAAAAFVKATLEGWTYAFKHKDEAVEIVLRRMRDARIPANRMHQKWMLEKMQGLIFPEGPATRAGQLKSADYDRVAAELLKAGGWKSASYSSFYKGCVTK
ncbi:MAG: ABC transporter substrate-binding protein [Elusimicrobiota bacterium]